MRRNALEDKAAMFDQDNILKSPRVVVARDPNASEPLRMVLEDPHQRALVQTAGGGHCLMRRFCSSRAGWILYCHCPASRKGRGSGTSRWSRLLFWLSITQGMVALSALLLRVTHASWRYPAKSDAGHGLPVRLSGFFALAAAAGTGRAVRFMRSASVNAPRQCLASSPARSDFDALAVGVSVRRRLAAAVPDIAARFCRPAGAVAGGFQGAAVLSQCHKLACHLCRSSVAAQSRRSKGSLDRVRNTSGGCCGGRRGC